MKELSIPSSPNWYLSRIVDCSDKGQLAYGSRESIVLFQQGEENSYSLIPNAHREKVTSVQFAPIAAGNKLVSSGDDFVVRIWDLDLLQATLAHIVHTNSQRTTVACWSQADPNLVVSADASGYIVSWNLQTNLTRTFHFKMSFTTISSSPHNETIIALGTKTGLLYVMDIKGKGQVIHKLRGHDFEIVSLAWCPVIENIFNPAEENTCLLASGARDNTIYLWRTASDGRYEKAIPLPPTPSADSGHRVQLPGTTGQHGAWTAVCWPEPNSLIAASPWGELIAYDLLKPSKDPEKSGAPMGNRKANNWRVLHSNHARGLFSIACRPYRGKSEGDTQEEIVLWTVAQDRQIVSCCLSSGKILRTMPTMGAPIYCLALSPIDGSRLALGVGDKSIRIWNLSDPNPDSMVSLWNKIAGKVYALAWHPKKEGCLAYGTSDGRIGLYDTMSNKPPIIFRLHFTQAVYVLQWGPHINLRGAIGSGEAAIAAEAAAAAQEEIPADEGKKSEYLLYAIADNTACAFDPDKPFEKPVDMKYILRGADAVGKIKMDRKRSGLSWKPDFSLLAVGNEDGSVHLLTPHEPTGMRHVRTILVHSKLIQDLAWHPPSSADEYLPSHSNWLAVASNESEIRVVDVSNLVANIADIKIDASEFQVPVVAVLKGHKQRVVTIVWNPHVGGQLLSTSYDESAVIWDVASAQPLRHFSDHCGIVLCSIWSPLEPDFAITGGGDAALRVWRISTQKEGAPQAKKKSKAFSGAKEALPDRSFDTRDEVKSDKYSHHVKESTVEVAKSEDSLRVDKKKMKEKSLFPVSGLLMNEPTHLLKNLERLIASKGDEAASLKVENGVAERQSENLKADSKEECSGAAPFFGGKEAVAELLERERAALVQSDNFESAFTLDVWRSKIKEAVEEAAKRQKLTDHIVSLSPMASMKVWQSACVAYADQLCRSGEYVKSADYYLAVHQVEKAVTMLLENGLHRQAVVIAKSRLATDDPFVKDVMKKWALQKLHQGQIEVAANCLASLEEWIEAADVLCRRRNVPHLCVAAQLASRGGADEKACTIFLDCLKLNDDENWNLLMSCLESLPNQKHLKLLVAVHQLVLKRFGEKLDPGRWLKGTFIDEDRSFEFDLAEKSSEIRNGKVPISKKFHVPLQKLLASGLSLSVRSEALLNVSINLALAMTQAPQYFTYLPEGFTYHGGDPGETDVHEAVCKLVQAMAALSSYQLRDPDSGHLLLKLCILLSPKGPTHFGSIFSEATTLSPAQKSCRAYLCTGILNWLVENGSSFIPLKAEVFPDRKPPLKGRRRISAREDATGKSECENGSVPKVDQPTEESEVILQPKQLTADQNTGYTSETADQKEGSTSETADQKEGSTSETADQKEGSTSETADQKEGSTSETADQKEGFTSETADQKEGFTSETADQKEGFTSEKADQKEGFTSEKADQKEGFTSEKADQKEGFTSETDDQKEGFTSETDDQKEGFTSEKADQKEGFTSGTDDQKEGSTSATADQKEASTSATADKSVDLTANHTAESLNETADETSVPVNCADQTATGPSADLTAESVQDKAPVDHYKPDWAQALDLIKRYGKDLFSLSNMRYFSDSVRIKVLLHHETSAPKEKFDSSTTQAKTSTNTETDEKTTKDGEYRPERSTDHDSEVKETVINSEPVLTERQLEIRKLQEWFSNFEKEQVCVPNPFVCYTNLNLVLNETLSKVDKQQTEFYVEYFKNVWEEAKTSKT